MISFSFHSCYRFLASSNNLSHKHHHHPPPQVSIPLRRVHQLLAKLQNAALTVERRPYTSAAKNMRSKLCKYTICSLLRCNTSLGRNIRAIKLRLCKRMVIDSGSSSSCWRHSGVGLSKWCKGAGLRSK